MTPTTSVTLAHRLETVLAMPMARTLGLRFTKVEPGHVDDATIKLVGPARGRVLRARGRVIDAGKLLTVCAAEVFAVSEDGEEALCATLLGTARNIEPDRRA